MVACIKFACPSGVVCGAPPEASGLGFHETADLIALVVKVAAG